MWGQWLGAFAGTNSGEVILNIDKDIKTRGKLSIYDITTNTPARWADIHFTKHQDRTSAIFVFLGEAPIIEGVIQPSHGMLQISELTDTLMTGDWETDIGTSGSFQLNKPDDTVFSAADYTFSWEEFNLWLNKQNEDSDLIFRGQKNSQWKLKTTFYRTGRYDLLRYGNEDVHRLNHYLVSLLNKSFNANDSVEHGALLNLAQHHGFPTPLLDWTESPYIAAFFAFSELPKDEYEGYVRLFTFNRGDWLADHNATNDMLDAKKYFSPHTLLPLHNPRALPQQSVVTSSNISDIESWFDSITPPHRKYLTKIDIPKSERAKVMRELMKMGITSASLFPGIEGTCKALKEKYF